MAEGDLSEGERDRTLPDFEGSSDGFIRGVFSDLRGVVLYAVRRWRDSERVGIDGVDSTLYK